MVKLTVATHAMPVWRERTDFILRVGISSDVTEVDSEQLWTRRIDDEQFELCCIPLFLYDLALGDVFRATAVGGGEPSIFRQVDIPSGRYVFRVNFPDKQSPRAETEDAVIAIGGLREWYSSELMAVDAKDFPRAQEIANYLSEQQKLGRLVYETGTKSQF